VGFGGIERLVVRIGVRFPPAASVFENHIIGEIAT